MPKTITWALLASTSPERLRQAVAEGPDDPPWRLVLGRSGVHAIVDVEPGSEHSGERELALELSQDGPCHVGYTDPPWISTCEHGAWVREGAGDVLALAEELGCPLAPPRSAAAAPSSLSVLRADGATADALAQALGLPDAPEAARDVQVHRVGDGAAAWSPSSMMFDRASTVSRRLETLVRAARVLPDGGLRCQVFDRGRLAGLYDTPQTRWSEGRRLPDVLGATSAADVLRALGWQPDAAQR
jgi:hypothetical protein